MALVRNTLTKQIALDSSLNGLSFDGLTVQIDSAESPLASFSFVLTFYGKNSSGRGSNTVLCTIAFQEPSDSAHGELPSGIKTSLFSLKTSCGKLSENSRLDIATIMFTSTNNVTNILLDKNTILKLQNR